MACLSTDGSQVIISCIIHVYKYINSGSSLIVVITVYHTDTSLSQIVEQTVNISPVESFPSLLEADSKDRE